MKIEMFGGPWDGKIITLGDDEKPKHDYLVRTKVGCEHTYQLIESSDGYRYRHVKVKRYVES